MKEKKKKEDKKQEENYELEEHVLQIKRVSKKTTGGNRISFTVLVVVGDKNGKVGIGLSRGREVPQAIRKAMRLAKKSMIVVPVYQSTIPHDVRVKFKSAVVILKPAPKGTGLKVGSVVRPLLSAAGISNASGKILRSRNKTTNTRAVMKALESLKPRGSQ
ncbi:MAG: ribosomal protein S5 [Candidatus Paceibacterota bacterium]